MSKHTAGPWVVIERKVPYSLRNGHQGFHIERSIVTGWDHPQATGPIPVVCKSTGIGMGEGMIESLCFIREDDARLIAAAPELLEVARYCENLFTAYSIDRVDGEEIADSALALLRSAIDKATGK